MRSPEWVLANWVAQTRLQPPGLVVRFRGARRQPPLHLQKHQPGQAGTDATGPVAA